MGLPRLYIVALVVVGALFTFIALTALRIVPVESVFLLLLNYVFQIFAVTVLAALGGVFLGMVLAHRMLASRSFNPFERELLATLAEIRAELERARARDEDLVERLRALEKRLE